MNCLTLEVSKVLWVLVVFSSLSVLYVKASFKVSYFRSPVVKLLPGIASNKYYPVDFPKEHLAVKNVFAEVVDGSGKSVPLTEAYLHHWVLERYYQRRGSYVSFASILSILNAQEKGDILFSNMNGTCGGGDIVAYGSGSETRRTDYSLPDPYAVEVGNPNRVPYGYDEKWMLNVHIIDTRGVVDRLGCLECRCDLFNVTTGFDGKPLPIDYKGGLQCCPDQKQCRLRQGFKKASRELYLKYVVHSLKWRNSVLPVKTYSFDVTVSSSNAMDPRKSCQGKTEYQVNPCVGKEESEKCVDQVRKRVVMPAGGYVVLVFGHQHIGGLGTAMYGQDKRLMCVSKPVYGDGNKAGDEKGYVVGMSSCRPQPGTMNLQKNEIIQLESIYNSSTLHTGVMGLFGLIIADELPNGKRH